MSGKNYAIFRIKKHHQSSKVGYLLNHHLRSVDVPNADPALKDQNRVLIKVDDPKKFINDVPEKTRKNAVRFVDMLFTGSEFKDKKQLSAWTDKTLRWAEKTFGKENIALAVLHTDETTPHIHMLFKPMKAGKLNASHWFKGRDKMIALQDSYHNEVKSLGFDRGERNSRAKHTTIKQFYSKVHQAETEHKAFTKELAKEAKSFEKMSLWEKAKYIKNNGLKPTLGKIVKQTKPTFLLAAMSNQKENKKLKQQIQEAKEQEETFKRQQEQLMQLTGSKYPTSSEINKLIDLKKKQELEEQQKIELQLSKQYHQHKQTSQQKNKRGYTP